MQKLTRSLFAIGMLAGLAACGDDVSVTEPPPPTPQVTGISVSPQTLNLRVGQTAPLSAVVTANDASVARTVTWTSSAANVATVSTAGVVTAVAAGQTTVTATSTADANFKAAVQVTVGGSGVTQIVVSPANATLAPGDQLQAVANVTADAGVARTVTWSSSAPTVATVSATGVISAVANGTTSIIARSTVDTSIFGAMALTVASTPATVSIKTITRNFGGLLAPVDLANTFGQIDVTLNVDPGSRQLCEVSVFIGSTKVASQTFGTSTNVQLSDSALAALVPTEVTLSVNTRAYDATTGVPSFFNGPQTLSASLTTRQGSACASAPDATVTQTLTFRNVSGFVGTVSTSGSASAQDLTGLTWRTGALTITALPVLFGDVNAPFTRPTIASAMISFGTPACVGLVRAQAATAAAPNWTAAFNNTDAAAAATNVVGYELNAVACAATAPVLIGEVPTITAVGSDGNAVTLIAGGFLNSPNLAGNQFAEPNANFAVRLDNLAPVRPTIEAGCVGCVGGFLYTNTTDTLRTSNWLNTALVLNEAVPVTPNPAGVSVAAAGTNMNGTIPVPPGTLVRISTLSQAIDLGVGRIINGVDPLNYQARTGDAALSNGTIDAQPTVTTAAGLAESSANNTYQLRARVADQLGNTSSTTEQSFGVDNTAPRLGVDTATTTAPVVSAAKAINAGHGIALNTVLIAFVAQDTAAGGATPSGFFNLAGSPLVTSVRRVRWTGTSVSTNWYCPTTGFQASLAGGGTCVDWFTGANQDFHGPLTQTFTNAGTNEGYFLTTSVVVDQAGNFSGSQAVEFLFDVTNPAVGGISSPAFLTGGTTATFSTSAQDNQDLGSGLFTLAYLGTADPFRFPSIAMGTFGSDVFTTTANLALQYSFIRSMQLAPAGVPNGAVGNIPNTVTAQAVDVAGNSSAVSTLVIPAGSIQGTPVAFAGFTWNITAPAAAVTVSRDDQAVAPAVNSVQITAQAVGPSGTFQNPFTSRVEFWAQSAVGQQWRQIGISTSPSVTDQPPNRTWSFSITWNPSSADAPVAAAGYRVIAIGVSAAGDALQSDANTNITMTIP